MHLLVLWGTAILLGVVVLRLPLWLSASLIAGAAVFLLTIIQPLVGLGLALLLGPFGALENVLFGDWPLNSGQIMLLFTLAAWLARGLSRRRLLIPHTFLNWPLGIFIFVAALSLLGAPSLEYGGRELLKWLQISLVMLMVVDCATPRQPAPQPIGQRVWPILTMLLLAGLSQALIGIWQFGLRGHGPEHFEILGSFYRAYGTFEQPNPFGGFMNLAALLALGALAGLAVARWQRWQSPSDAPQPWPWPVSLLIVVCAAAGSLALVLSWSRGAWLSFGVGTAVLILFWPRQRRYGALLLLLGGVFLLTSLHLNFIPTSVTERLVSFGQDLRFEDVRGANIHDANYAVLERLAHWQAALYMAADYPWLGVGFGNYEPAYARYALLNWPDALGHAHNYYLNILAETGVIGLAAYLLFWGAVFWQTVRALRQPDWVGRGIALGLLAAWAALTTHHLVDKLYVNNVYIYLGVMLGLLQIAAGQNWHSLRHTAKLKGI